jgi:hypothetical protein
MIPNRGDRYHVESHYQSGGITAGKVEITAPRVGFSGVEFAFANEPHGGSYLTRAVLHIDASYAAESLHVLARGNSINSFDLAPAPTAAEQASGAWGNMMTNVWRGPVTSQEAEMSVGSPLKKAYWVDVSTAEPDDLVIEAAVEA